MIAAAHALQAAAGVAATTVPTGKASSNAAAATVQERARTCAKSKKRATVPASTVAKKPKWITDKMAAKLAAGTRTPPEKDPPVPTRVSSGAKRAASQPNTTGTRKLSKPCMPARTHTHLHDNGRTRSILQRTHACVQVQNHARSYTEYTCTRA
eukprot:197873-Pleurochrysis_carterae.AAC.1